MIKAIIFDWGGVLIDNPTQDLMDYFAGRLGIEGDTLAKAFRPYEQRFQKGLITESQLWEEMCSNLAIQGPTPFLWKEAVRSVFREKPEVFALVRELREKGFKVGFLSNTEIPTMEYFQEKEYGRFFDAVVFSCAEGAAKPEPEIYHIILKKLGLPPEETVFIDDRSEYVQGAKNIGMGAIVFESEKKVREDLYSLIEKEKKS